MKLTVLFRSCFLLLIVLSLSACDKVVVDTDTPSNNEARRNGEKRFTTRGGELSHDVTPEDIEAYIKYKDLASKDSYFEVKSIIPFPNEDNPVLYAINFKNHWEMISSSKRTSPIIACGEGEFNPATDNENFLAWLGVLAEEISVLKATNFQPKDSTSAENAQAGIGQTSIIAIITSSKHLPDDVVATIERWLKIRLEDENVTVMQK